MHCDMDRNGVEIFIELLLDTEKTKMFNGESEI